jgi:hypothetical protein
MKKVLSIPVVEGIIKRALAELKIKGGWIGKDVYETGRRERELIEKIRNQILVSAGMSMGELAFDFMVADLEVKVIDEGSVSYAVYIGNAGRRLKDEKLTNITSPSIGIYHFLVYPVKEKVFYPGSREGVKKYILIAAAKGWFDVQNGDEVDVLVEEVLERL